MKIILSLICLFLVGFGCNGTTTIDLSEENGRVELSDDLKEEIEDIVRDVVREELAQIEVEGNTRVAQALKEAQGKNDRALVEEKKKNAEAMVMTCLRIASDAQAWLRKPAAFGGAVPASGERPSDFEGQTLTFEQLGYPIDEKGIFTDINGNFELGIQGGTLLIKGRSTTYSNEVVVQVAGALTQDIKTEIKSLP